jgi:hypothetical protein
MGTTSGVAPLAGVVLLATPTQHKKSKSWHGVPLKKVNEERKMGMGIWEDEAAA